MAAVVGRGRSELSSFLRRWRMAGFAQEGKEGRRVVVVVACTHTKTLLGQQPRLSLPLAEAATTAAAGAVPTTLSAALSLSLPLSLSLARSAIVT